MTSQRGRKESGVRKPEVGAEKKLDLGKQKNQISQEHRMVVHKSRGTPQRLEIGSSWNAGQHNEHNHESRKTQAGSSVKRNGPLTTEQGIFVTLTTFHGGSCRALMVVQWQERLLRSATTLPFHLSFVHRSLQIGYLRNNCSIWGDQTAATKTAKSGCWYSCEFFNNYEDGRNWTGTKRREACDFFSCLVSNCETGYDHHENH